LSRGERGCPPRLDGILARAALNQPQRQAVVFGELSWTYAEVYDRACRLAGALAALGVGKGDRVALWATNRPEFIEVFFGVPMLGAIALPMDFWWGWNDASAALAQTRPKVLIVGPAQAEQVAGASAAIRQVGIERVLCLDEPPADRGLASYRELIAAAPRLGVPTEVAPIDPAIILFTSGSTGRSKGAVHTHGGLTTTALIMCLELGWTEGERTLHFLPLFSSCLEQLLPLTLACATHIVMAEFDAKAVWETIRGGGVTHFDAVPTTLRRILEAAPPEIPPSLRLISYASERMPEPLITALIDRMPGVDFVQFYGMIEQLCLTVLSPADQLRKIGTVGRPMFGAQLRLINGSDPETEATTTGEIVARSPTGFAGYWQDPGATAQVMRDQWLRTGDLGRFDEDGYLWLDGRVKEMIKSGGMTVIPTEVESVLMAHPSVTDAAVVGVPDEQWGEAVHAFVILAPGEAVSPVELKTYCHDRLTGYKRPKAIHVVTELPRTGIGKIARRVVRDRLIASDNS
jgi:acyl-CoA synthetase (AMP-forming)/AMP-acid ligase II